MSAPLAVLALTVFCPEDEQEEVRAYLDDCFLQAPMPLYGGVTSEAATQDEDAVRFFQELELDLPPMEAAMEEYVVGVHTDPLHPPTVWINVMATNPADALTYAKDKVPHLADYQFTVEARTHISTQE